MDMYHYIIKHYPTIDYGPWTIDHN